MPAEPKKKRQHYVPRLILRGFSRDERTISVFVLGSAKRIDDAGLRNQCYEDYFYGQDPALEDGFAKLEGEFANALGDLGRHHLDAIQPDQADKIRQFIHYQRHRTLGAATELNDLNEALAKKVLSNDARFADVLDRMRIKTPQPQFDSLYLAVQTFPLVLDLGLKFLVSDKKKTFIVSDNPVVACNQFVEHHAVLREHPSGSTGLAVKGLQLFLPVSPRICVALYDASTYRYGSKEHLTCGVSSRDVLALNSLQVLTAHECIYFDGSLTDADELERLRRERMKHDGWKEPEFAETPVTRRPDGLLSQFIMFRTPDLRLGPKFTFSEVTDRTDYSSYAAGTLPPRSQAHLDLFEQYCNFIDRKAEEARARGSAAEPVSAGVADVERLPSTEGRTSE